MRVNSRGKLTIVGIGQGGDSLTLAALKALREATDIVGYRTYLKLISDIIMDKEVHSFAMGKEIQRAGRAIELARAGRKVALVSSGDAGVYGMAGPVLELLDEGERGTTKGERAISNLGIDVKIIPGVTAATSAAAALGAPLMNDFAVVSLSDLLIPWSEIERRLTALARADIVMAVYNPKSRQRTRQLDRALEILLEHRPPSTPAAVVRNAGHPDQGAVVTTLDKLAEADIDMRSVLIIGDSRTRSGNGMLIAARGYRI